MSAHTLEAMALELFDQEYEREAARGAGQRRVHRSFDRQVEACPVAWVMHELVQLLEENHTEPVETLRPCIRQLIAEKAFAFGGGYARDPERAVDQEVDLIIRTLERLREYAFESGQWSAIDYSPEMFVG